MEKDFGEKWRSGVRCQGVLVETLSKPGAMPAGEELTVAEPLVSKRLKAAPGTYACVFAEIANVAPRQHVVGRPGEKNRRTRAIWESFAAGGKINRGTPTLAHGRP
jgi:hypothetical protein